jgi:acetylornithine deacetylase/succinyl-diaminopimelate desuccinylase-like protein
MRAMGRLILVLSAAGAALSIAAQTPRPDWAQVDRETLRHFQALVRINTTDPPGGERPAAEYLKQVLEKEGIQSQFFALEAHRPNLVVRLKGSGRKRPLLIMAHTDTVNIDEKKWTVPPFSAALQSGHVYGRGTIDDKDNVVASLMTVLLLRRLDVPLDRDVIFLAESGEEGTTRVGIKFMVEEHFGAIDAEYCLAEGGNVTRQDGRVTYSSVQTLEKIPRAIELVARGPAGHGSVPLKSNAVVHLTSAVSRVAQWQPPIRLNETTRVYFERLAAISPTQLAARYRALLGNDAKAIQAADEYLLEHEPRHASMIRTSIAPTIVQAGYRVNVIPSEVRATLDVRLHPGEDAAAFLAEVRNVVNDPAVEVNWAPRDVRPGTDSARLDFEAFQAIERMTKKHYDTVTLPTMSTGATDMAYLRAKGVQCYGIGPALDAEDGTKGFGAHSDQERILESELYRFVRFHYELVEDLARAK